jgi:hypothetical protein
MTTESRVVTFTPKLATEWLEHNKINRTIRDKVVQRYADDMRADRWLMNGSTIVRDDNTNLLDGQHRLWACVVADTNFTTLVVEGVQRDAYKVIDSGIPRKMSDVLRHQGEHSVAQLSAAISLSYRYEHDMLQGARSPASRQTLLDYLDANPGIRDGIKIAEAVRRKLRIPGSVVATVYYQTAKLNPADAALFFERLMAGSDLGEGSPILALRRWLDRINRVQGRRVLSEHQLAVVIKAMNAFRHGRTISQLTWRPASGEPYPRIEPLPDDEGW